MKLFLWISLVSLFVGGAVCAQDLPTSFRFNCESGEASMDAHYDDYTWVLDGTVLSYTESFSGQYAGMSNKPGRTFPINVTLTQKQLDKLKPLIRAVLKMHSLSLMPEHNFQGSFASYVFRYGTPVKEISFEAPEYEMRKWTKDDVGDQSKRYRPEPAFSMVATFDALRDYLMTLNS